MTEQEKGVLLTLAVLGATNTRDSVVQNIPNGEEAFDHMEAQHYISRTANGLFVLSHKGWQETQKIQREIEVTSH